MLIYLDIKIPHLQIAHQGGNLEVGNIEIHPQLGLTNPLAISICFPQNPLFYYF